MHEMINSFENWIANNVIAICALVIAIIQGWLMVWQVRKTLREQRDRALAEQRYIIYEHVLALMTH